MFKWVAITVRQGSTLQYRSKVSYHPSSLVSRDESLDSRDETLVSREPMKRIFWNKLQQLAWEETINFSRRVCCNV